MNTVPFVKYQAAGNDFIVVPAKDLGSGGRGRPTPARLESLARAILARHTGIGADGLLVVRPPAKPKHHLALQIFNADGSEAEMSGNGIRCAAAWLLDRVPIGRALGDVEKMLDIAMALMRIDIETPAGVKTVEHVHTRRSERFFRVAMGKPVLQPAKIPFGAAGVAAPVNRYPLPTSLGVKEATVTSMGNPHCSLFVESFDELDWRALGREIERHPLFPNRTNVEFVRVISAREIEVRFWERGVGETASSGTGSSAAAVAAALNGLTGRKVRVKTPGGELEVQWAKSNEVFLTGPVRVVSRGEYEYDDRNAPTPM